MNYKLDQKTSAKINEELALLDREKVNVNGVELLPSQCYHVGDHPAHILFNTNCPDELKQKVTSILSKYNLIDENRS